MSNLAQTGATDRLKLYPSLPPDRAPIDADVDLQG